MALAVRLATYLTFFMGFAMFVNWLPRAEPWTTAHLVVGLLTAVLALVGIPTGVGPRRGIRITARVWPLLTALVGLTLFFRVAPPVVVMVHAVMGFLALLLVELALSRRARGAR